MATKTFTIRYYPVVAVPAADVPVLVPGDGFSGATAQPAAVGDSGAAGYDQTAIARWDVAPLQKFTGDLYVGIIAFHIEGIASVAFSVDNGAWVATATPTYNQQTSMLTVTDGASAGSTNLSSATGGFTAAMVGKTIDISGGTVTTARRTIAAVVDTNNVTVSGAALNTGTGSTIRVGERLEYTAKLDATDFADGLVEVRAIIYPVSGIPRVLGGALTAANLAVGEHSMFLNANSGGTLPAAVKYVATTGNDTTGDGSAETPYLTMAKAALAIQTAQGSVDHATIYLQEGSYQFGNISSPWPSNTTGWITITSAPGADPAAVKLTTSTGNGLRTKWVHVTNLTLEPTAETAYILLSGGMSALGGLAFLWLDHVNGTGLSQVTTRWVSGFDGVFCHDCAFTLANSGMAGWLLRNIHYIDIAEDVCNGAGLLDGVHCVRTQGLGAEALAAGLHSDIYQNLGNNENIILRGLTNDFGANDDFGQGIFSGRASLEAGYTLKDVAIVDCVVAIDLDTGGTVFGFEGPVQHMLVKDSTFTGQALWRTDFFFTADDVVVDSCSFVTSGGTFTEPSPRAESRPAGVTVI